MRNYSILTYGIAIFSHLKLCLATAIQNFKSLKMYAIYKIKVTRYSSVSRFKNNLI